MVEAMDALLAELNAAHHLDIERHPAWSPIILDAASVNIGYKLHRKQASPDRVISLVVHPLDFGRGGQLNRKSRARIVAEVTKFWDGKNSEHHTFVDVSS
jgi:hypothetical protein